MPGVCCKLCFDDGEEDCLPRCYHGRYGLKNTLKCFLKKKLTLLFGKNIYRNGTKTFMTLIIKQKVVSNHVVR